MKCDIHDNKDTRGKCSCSGIVKDLRFLIVDYFEGEHTARSKAEARDYLLRRVK